MTPIRVMSFNIRGALKGRDGVNAWDNRASLNVHTVLRHIPDLIGFQELQDGNLDIYRTHLSSYLYIKGPETDNQKPYGYNAIFWNPMRFTMMDAGYFWLSLTPEKYSAAWDTTCIRAVNWVRFHCLDTGFEFIHFNTHLDHESDLARIEGSKLIIRKMKQLRMNNLPIILTGDFNSNPNSSVYRLFLENGFVDTYIASGNMNTHYAYTFHGFTGRLYSLPNNDVGGRIDWILTLDGTQKFQTKTCSILLDHEAPLYPSDHYPVLSELSLIQSANI